jgi:hypothetical protein
VACWHVRDFRLCVLALRLGFDSWLCSAPSAPRRVLRLQRAQIGVLPPLAFRPR